MGLAACGSSDPGGNTCSPTDPACSPGDTTTTLQPLTVTSVSPVNGATGVEPSTLVTLTFSAAVNPASVTASSVNLGSVDGSLTVLGSVVTLEPDGDLAPGSTYALSVDGVTATDGTFRLSAFSSSFTTKDAPVAADAGPDMTVTAGCSVVLDGSRSSGSSVAWTQIEGADVGALSGTSPTATPTSSGAGGPRA